MMYISDVFKTTNFWPELRESTDAYERYDLSLKQKLPIKGLELFLNVSNLNEAIDVNRLRGSTEQTQILQTNSMMKLHPAHWKLLQLNV